MASTPEIQVEDQMGEDFFDKLVGDDEFGLAGSVSASGDMARALSSMSIGDVGASVDNFEGDDQHEVEKVVVSEPREKDSLVLEESSALAQCGSFPLDEVVAVQSSDPVETVAELGSPGSLTGKSVGPKGTSVKEVQWSSFSSGQGQLDMGGFGSYSNFFTEVPNVLTTHSVVGIETKDAVADLSTYFSSFETKEVQHHGFANQHPAYSISSEQLDAQAYGLHNEQAAAGNEFQDWENSLPGWKCDANSGQWYQVDSCHNMTEVQAGGYGSAVMNSREDVHVSTLPVDVAAVRGQISEVSYSQQTAQSVAESVVKYCATAGVSNWNLDSCENTKYPPNMVFDPQYPGWYYDRNTLEWYSLESYTQSLQITSNITQNQQTQDVSGSSDIFSAEQRHTLDDNVVCPSKTQTLGSQSQEQGDWGGLGGNYHQHNTCRPEQDDKGGSLDGFSGNQTKGRFYGAPNYEGNYADQQVDFPTIETVSDPLYSRSVGANSFAAFVPAENIYQFSQPKTEEICHANVSQSYSLNQNMVNYSQQLCQSQSASYSQLSYTPNGGRSLEGRPLHALVTFGFGGKLIVMKDTTSFGTNLAYGSQNVTGREVSVLNLTEVVMEKTDFSGIGNHSYDYFHALCKQSFPGPLVGGNAGNKDLNKWVDERITSCGTSTMDFREGELLGLLLSLLKIFCQHYGKLRSPFTVGSALQDSDGPELAVTKLFASARKNGDHLRDYGAFNHCMHNLPSEGQIQSTAIEVQNLLVSGRRKEALQCAQDGQLWGPALVLAAQLGDEFYVDMVKQMARKQFVSGSPLRTLCLLIAGQPADVFSMDNSDNSSNGVMNMSPQPMQVSANGSMLDDWEENLAIITANRTKDDELVIIHLGDCLWKERGEITAAHTCYLVAEANLESYSDKARMCLIGADHWKCPRTYASPEAIQRTEFYEYSKVLGNSQFISIPFQHYKLVYAHMLAELGKIQDSLKYCQATLKLLKNAGRTPEVETLKVLVSSLEERLRTHQQGGYGTNLAPTKLVGKIFNSIDKSLHRMIGAPPQSLPPIPPGNLHTNGHDKIMVAPKVGNSQSTMAMSSLVPLASVETIREWTDDGRKTMHNRSISEPDFGRSPKQVNSSKDDFSTHVQSQTLRASSRFGLFGSQLLQKTVGWMSRSRQAKLGESNKFYYDEQLKRWVEEGAEPPAEEAALLPPPTTAFQNGIPDCNRNNGFITKNISSNGVLETKTSNSIEHSPGIPPVPPSQNQFSAGGRMGVRSRYVDTFNKGGGMPKNSFQSPSVPSVKPVGGAKLFIPTAVTSSELTADFTESTRETSSNEDSSASVVRDSSFSSLSSSSSFTMQCFPSMDTISPIKNKGIGAPLQNGNGTLSSQTRAASWNGSYSDAFNHKMTDMKHVANGLSVPSSFAADNYSPMSSTNGLLLANGSSSGDDLHEVEL